MTKRMDPELFLQSLGKTPDEVAKNVPIGDPQDAEFCPVARALSKRFRRWGWIVGSTRAERNEDGATFKLPPAVKAFTRRFDEGKYPHLVRTT